MEYIHIRKQLSMLFYILIPIVLILAKVWDAIFLAIGGVIGAGIIYSFFESKFAKCPSCKKHPISFLGGVPPCCPTCGENFREHT